MKQNTVIVFAALGLSATAWADESPQIVQIRQNYLTVNQELNLYHKEYKDGPVCGDISSDYTRWLDRRGQVRKLMVNYYNDSVALGFTQKYELWFDQEGRLNFVLFRKTENMGEYLQTQKQVIEMRAYYDSKGQIIKILNKYPMAKAEEQNHIQDFKKMAVKGWPLADEGC